MVTRSKVYIEPTTKKKVISFFLNMILAIYLLANIVIVFMEGISIRILGSMCIAIFIVKGYLSIKRVKGYYEFATAEIGIDSKMMLIEYKNVNYDDKTNCDINIKVNIDELEKIEYSDRLIAFRFVGVIEQNLSNNSSKTIMLNEWLLYIEKDLKKDIAGLLEKETGQIIRYVDEAQN